MKQDKLIIDAETPVQFDPRTEMYAIRIVEWRRVRRVVQALPSRSTLWANAAWAGFGIAASFLVGALSIPDGGSGIAPWIRPLSWSIAVAAFVVSCLSLLMQRSHDQLTTSGREQCLALLDEIDDGFTEAPVISSSHQTTEPSAKLLSSTKVLGTEVRDTGRTSLINVLNDNIASSVLGRGAADKEK